MKRPLVVAVLTATLFINACAPHQDVLPPGEDPNQLVEAIVKRGQGEGPPAEPAPPGSPVLGNCLETGVKVCATCLAVSLFLGLLVGLAASRASASGSSGVGGGLGEAIRTLWSHD
jgi:hypothetical protein